jgi:hypothetical protein
MAGPRDRHVGKTQEERQEYLNTVHGEAPTVDTLPPFDSTDTVVPPSQSPQYYPPPLPPSSSARIASFFRDNAGAIFWSLLTVAIGVLYSLFWETHNLVSGLNREVGEIKVGVDTQRKDAAVTAEHLRSLVDKLENRFTRTEDRLNSFITDSLRESARRNEPHPVVKDKSK